MAILICQKLFKNWKQVAMSATFLGISDTYMIGKISLLKKKRLLHGYYEKLKTIMLHNKM